MKILTIHGIRAKTKWAHQLETFEEFKSDAYDIEHFKYGEHGYFTMWQFISASSREDVYKEFAKYYAKHSTDGPPSIICHSFGTYILYHTLLKYPYVQFDRVILFGSILDPQIDLSPFFEIGQIRELLHDIGRKDLWVRFSPFILGPTAGNSGEIGFTYLPIRYRNQIIQNEYDGFDHSDAAFHLHMKKVWVPFLIRPRYEYNTSILRPEVIDWAYSHPTIGDRRITVEKAQFFARIDSEGNYFGRYIFNCINHSEASLSVFPIAISSDSAEPFSKISFKAYDCSMNPLNPEVRVDDPHVRHVDIAFDPGISPGERFEFRYKFKLSETMRYDGDSDHFRIHLAKRVEVQVNSHFRLKSPVFFGLRKRLIMDRFDAESKRELDGSITYYYTLDNKQSEFDVFCFYYDGYHEDTSERRGYCLSKNTTLAKIGDLSVRPVNRDDIQKVYALEKGIEEEEVADERTLIQRSMMFRDGFMVALIDGKIVGYIESLLWHGRHFTTFKDIADFPIHHSLNGDSLYIIFLAVDIPFRGCGIGELLLRCMEEIAKHYRVGKIQLVAKNHLENYYSKRGYRAVRPLEYFLRSDHKPSIFMEKTL